MGKGVEREKGDKGGEVRGRLSYHDYDLLFPGDEQTSLLAHNV